MKKFTFLPNPDCTDYTLEVDHIFLDRFNIVHWEDKNGNLADGGMNISFFDKIVNNETGVVTIISEWPCVTCPLRGNCVDKALDVVACGFWPEE